MKKVLSILLIGLFAVALVFAQEKATKPEKAKAQKMECCKEAKEDCCEGCSKMKSEMKGKHKDCPKADKTQKEAEPKKDAK